MIYIFQIHISNFDSEENDYLNCVRGEVKRINERNPNSFYDVKSRNLKKCPFRKVDEKEKG